jgi:hypothetical protein
MYVIDSELPRAWLIRSGGGKPATLAGFTTKCGNPQFASTSAFTRAENFLPTALGDANCGRFTAVAKNELHGFRFWEH